MNRTITLPVEIVTEFSDTLKGLEEHNRSLKKILAENAVAFLNIFKSEMAKTLGPETAKILNTFASLFAKYGGDIQALWQENWKSIVDFGLGALNQLASEAGSIIVGLTSSFTSAISSYLATGSFWQAAFSGLQGIFSGFASIFSGPDNQDLLKSQAQQAAQIYGSAFTESVYAVMQQVAEGLPRAQSGKIDVLAAMYHPDTIAAVLDNITDFGFEMQDKFALIFREHVKPVLINTLGFSEEEAAQMMAPLYQQIIDGALAAGEAISPAMQQSINWAIALGVELETGAVEAMNTFAESGEKALDTLNNKLEILSTNLAKVVALAKRLSFSGAGSINNATASQPGIISAAAGVDTVLSGPASGYQVPLVMHGTERLTVSPADKQQRGSTFNITIYSDNPQSFRKWIASGGDVEISNSIARAAKSKNTLLKPTISRR